MLDTGRILAFVVYLTPSPVAADIDPTLLARAESLLGQTCRTIEEREENRRQTRELFAEISAARAGGDYLGAAEIQKRMVATRCDSPRAWVRLASLLNRAGDEAAALEALELAFDLGSNDVEHHLRGEWTDLDTLRRSAVFPGTSLAAKLAAAEAERDQRVAAARKRLPTEPRPELPHVTYDICPFECCIYGEWTVTEDTILYAAIGEGLMAGTARAGTRVEAVTGQVHVTDVLPILVVHGHEVGTADGANREKLRLAVGDLVFVLHYVGEGYSLAWHDGRVVGIESKDAAAHCPHPSPGCWGEHLASPSEQVEPSWWVQIRLADGTTGWTRETRNFDGMDGCS